MNGGDVSAYGVSTALQRILNRNTLDTVGVILNDAGEVLTFESDPVYREVVDRITAKGLDGTIVPARTGRMLISAPGRIVQIEGDLPARLRLAEEDTAVVVTQVEQGTPAALARINMYELIRAVDGERVDSVGTFEKLIAAARQQDKPSVRLTIEWMGRTRLADLKFDAAVPSGLLKSLLEGRQ